MTEFIKRREQINQFIDKLFFTVLELIFGFIAQTGRLCRFIFESVQLFFAKPYRFNELILHMEFIGNKSVFIICLTGIFTGMALSFQVYLGFEIVNATSLVGPTVGLGIARELGPVLTGLIVSARAGGAMAARLGTMRVTEQIDALEVMAIRPKQYLISPRIVAATVAMPILTGVFIFVAMLGSYILVVKVLKADEAIFWDKTAYWLNPNHINEGLIKAAVFGFVFSGICCFQGYYTKGGARGVGEATNKGVVLSMVMIIILDFFLMNLIDVYYKVTS